MRYIHKSLAVSGHLMCHKYQIRSLHFPFAVTHQFTAVMMVIDIDIEKEYADEHGRNQQYYATVQTRFIG